MRFKLDNSNRRLYLRIFLSITLCIVLIMLALSLILYVNFENTVSNQIYHESVRSLNQVNIQVSNMANNALNTAYQIFRDFSISKLLYYSDPDIFDLTPALTQLVNYRLSAPFIDSIYVYNGNTDAFYVETGKYERMGEHRKDFADTDIVNRIDNYKDYRPYIPIPRLYINKYDNSVREYYYTFLMYDMVDEVNAVVININEEWIRNVINPETNSDGSDTFIVDSKGVLVTNTVDSPMLTDFSGKDYVKHILEQSDAGYFVSSIKGVKSLIVYTQPDSFGWRYVRTIPWNTVYKDVTRIRDITIFICLGILFLSVLISFLVSRRIFSPIGKMITNLESLENEKRLNKSNLKQEFIKDMALGMLMLNETHIASRYKELEVNIGIDRNICAILLMIDDYNQFIQSYNIDERNLYKFAMINISSELLSQFGKLEAADIGNDMILLVLDTSEIDILQQRTEIENTLKKLQYYVLEYYKLSLTATVSTTDKTMESLHQVYNQILQASQYRVFRGLGSIIFEQDLEQISVKVYDFPIQKEKLLTEALMTSKMDDTRKLYNEIVKGTYEYSIIAFNLTISHLLFSISNTVQAIKNNNLLPADFDVDISVMFLNQAQTAEEINNRFYELFERIEASLDERKKSKYDVVVNKISKIIATQYNSTSLSIDSIAEELGMSTAYICRLYKQNTLHTILDDIVKIRMEKARELLQNSEMSVVEIAEKTGYSNPTYFYKAFKSVNGVTPNEFRKNSK